MDPDPTPIYLHVIQLLFVVKPFTVNIIVVLLAMAVCLILSALMSAAEVAFFSLAPKDTDELKESTARIDKTIIQLLDKPKQLLASQLIAVNFLNIGVVVLSEFIMDELFDFSSSPTLGFILQVIVITFLILLVAEVVPKVYANRNPVSTVRFMTYPTVFIQKLFWPFSYILIGTTSFIDSRIKKRSISISVDELSQALELTSGEDTTESEKKLLKGIVKFGNLEVCDIMKPRMDVIGFDQDKSFAELMDLVVKSGFSRVPIYKGTLDSIVGVLYIKDLLPYIGNYGNFNWTSLIREPFFIPENKTLDDLLREFQTAKIHLAIVVDEYGGTSGIVTLEDIIEEIVGEINDEFDDEDVVYSKLDAYNYVFEGKVSINDMCRILELDTDLFENERGGADTLGGFILEHTEKIPRKNDFIKFLDFVFTIEAADNRKIKRVKVTLPKNEMDESKV